MSPRGGAALARALGAALLAASASGAGGDGPAPLVVATCNLRFASPRPPHAWPERRPALRALLAGTAADVIGTQEGLYEQLKDVARDLDGYAWIGVGRDGGSRGEFTAIFYRVERLEPLAFDHFWLSDTPDVIGSSTWGAACRRMATWVRFRDRADGGELVVCNTHLDHAVESARVKGARLLLERLGAFGPELPVLLVGDFNAAAGASPVASILVGERAFADTWTSAQTRGESVGTFHGFAAPRADGPRIDWILARGLARTSSAEIACGGRDGVWPSDHCAVVARVELPARATRR